MIRLYKSPSEVPKETGVLYKTNLMQYNKDFKLYESKIVTNCHPLLCVPCHDATPEKHDKRCRKEQKNHLNPPPFRVDLSKSIKQLS